MAFEVDPTPRVFDPRAAEVGTQGASAAAAGRPGRPDVRLGAAVLRPGAPITKDQLIATLRECQGALEEEMRTIDVRVPGYEGDDIDLLALDRTRQLTIVDVSVANGDELLQRGLSHVDWVARHIAIVQRMYPEWAINYTRPARLILVAPRFPPRLRNALRQAAFSAAACYRYHVVDLAGGAGILFERLGDAGD
jgi:hypothetical protein